MNYRELLASEAWFLKEMLFEAIYIPPGRKPYPRSVLEHPELSKYFLNWKSDPSDRAVAGESAGKLIAVAWGRAHHPPNEGFGYIDIDIPEISIAVKADYRNQGLGGRLLEKLSQTYQQTGVKAISLSVDKRNQAVSLYKRHGFVIVKENSEDFIMRKNLSS